MSPTDVDGTARIERLSAASVRRVVEPDVEVTGEFGSRAVTAPELLSVAGLGLDLTPEQLADLSREELASVTEASIRFEAGLMSGTAFETFTAADVTDPRISYVWHEMGEETRHSRLFARMIRQLEPRARNPLNRRPLRYLQGRVAPAFFRQPALLITVVLAGEEITDLLQKRICEHPDSDPYLVAISRYHRQEEARHVIFNRIILAERWVAARRLERAAVRHLAPLVVRAVFATLVHPGVYATVGLPRWRTWWACNRSPQRLALLHEAIGSVVEAMVDAGVFRPDRVPRGWRRLSGGLAP